MRDYPSKPNPYIRLPHPAQASDSLAESDLSFCDFRPEIFTPILSTCHGVSLIFFVFFLYVQSSNSLSFLKKEKRKGRSRKRAEKEVVVVGG